MQNVPCIRGKQQQQQRYRGVMNGVVGPLADHADTWLLGPKCLYLNCYVVLDSNKQIGLDLKSIGFDASFGGM